MKTEHKERREFRAGDHVYKSRKVGKQSGSKVKRGESCYASNPTFLGHCDVIIKYQVVLV